MRLPFHLTLVQVGTITDAHCEQDILDAQALGADGFALNLSKQTFDWPCLNTIVNDI